MSYEINNKVFNNFPILESERLLFREIDLNDAQYFYSLRNNPDVMRFMDISGHKDKDETNKMINDLQSSFRKKENLNWVIQHKNKNKPIGYFTYWKIDAEHKRAEIGYALDPSYWRQGYMSEAFKLLIHFAFQKLNIHSIEANVNPENNNSINILQKFGFKKEAYFRENYFYDGRFLDSAIYSLLEPDFLT